MAGTRKTPETDKTVTRYNQEDVLEPASPEIEIVARFIKVLERT